MCVIVANERHLSDITNILWGPFCFGYKKNSSRVPRWHPADLGSGHVQVIQSTIKRLPYPKTRFTPKTPFGNWTIKVMKVLICDC